MIRRAVRAGPSCLGCRLELAPSERNGVVRTRLYEISETFVVVDGAASRVREALAENCAIPCATAADRNGGIGSVDDCVTARAARQVDRLAPSVVDLHIQRNIRGIRNRSPT